MLAWRAANRFPAITVAANEGVRVAQRRRVPMKVRYRNVVLAGLAGLAVALAGAAVVAVRATDAPGSISLEVGGGPLAAGSGTTDTTALEGPVSTVAPVAPVATVTAPSVPEATGRRFPQCLEGENMASMIATLGFGLSDVAAITPVETPLEAAQRYVAAQPIQRWSSFGPDDLRFQMLPSSAGPVQDGRVVVMGLHGERMVMFFRLVLGPLGQYSIAESSECIASVPVDNRLPCDPYCRPGFESEMAPEGEAPLYRPLLSMPDVLRCLPGEQRQAVDPHPIIGFEHNFPVMVTDPPLDRPEDAVARFVSGRGLRWAGAGPLALRWEWAPLETWGPHDRAGLAYLADRPVIYAQAVLNLDATYAVNGYRICATDLGG